MNNNPNALHKSVALLSSVLYHPDYTVGPGITPDLLTLLVKAKRRSRALCVCTFTAGGELHPALRTFLQLAPERLIYGGLSLTTSDSLWRLHRNLKLIDYCFRLLPITNLPRVFNADF